MNNITKALLNIKEFAESEKPLDFLLIAVNEAKAEFQNRIFNSEEGAKDVKGKKLFSRISKESKYSNPYVKYRRSKGRQTNYIDLEFTGSLRRDIKVLKTEDKVFIDIISGFELSKVAHLENLYNTNIFSLNNDEKEIYKRKSNDLFIREIKKICKNE